MGHGHSHGHAADGKSDPWTKVATITELTSSLVGDAYWAGSLLFVCVSAIGSLMQVCQKSNATTTGFTTIDPSVPTAGDTIYLGLPIYALIVGVMVSILSASGAAYCHYNLNTLHQGVKDKHDHPADVESGDDKEVGRYHSLDEQEKELTEVATQVARQQLTAGLSGVQWLALVGDGISHTGDTASNFALLLGLFEMDTPLPALVKAAAVIGITIYGALGSVANVRTCKNALIQRVGALPAASSHNHHGHGNR